MEVGVENADRPVEKYVQPALPMGASAVQSRGMTSRGSRIWHRQRRRKKANIRANKPVPERRTQSHAVAGAPPYSVLDEPERDNAGQSDTTCDTTDQKVGDSSSSERASKSPGRWLAGASERRREVRSSL